MSGVTEYKKKKKSWIESWTGHTLVVEKVPDKISLTHYDCCGKQVNGCEYPHKIQNR